MQSVQKAILHIDAEIIVIDNNSTDTSCEMLRSKFPNVTLIANTVNYGFPKGNNIGVDVAKGEYVCILNPDTVVAEDTFEKTLQYADSKNKLGAVGVRLVDGVGGFLPESKRGIPTPWVAFTKIIGLYKLFPNFRWANQYYASHLTETQSGKVSILVGAFMLLKRKTYLEVGGFDEDCFMYSDDIDLSYMLLQKGLQNYYFSETTVIHYKGESTVKDGKYMQRFREAMNFFYKKHFKISPFFNVFMILGMYFFSFLKWLRGNALVVKSPTTYLVVTSDNNTIINLKKTLLKEVIPVSSVDLLHEILQKNKAEAVEIIFDNQFISFKKIIETIVTCRAKSITFKILPEKSFFIIGSNSSNHRGEVIPLKNVTLKS